MNIAFLVKRSLPYSNKYRKTCDMMFDMHKAHGEGAPPSHWVG